MTKEYGGCLPLELNIGQEFDFPGFDVKALNSGRTAISYAAVSGGFKRAYIPYYTCKTVEAALIDAGVMLSYYNIDESFMPIEPATGFDDSALFVYTNYFGIMTRQMQQDVLKAHAHVLFDNTQGFFTEPVHGAYNAYSCRKFFGVPDGAYLVADNLTDLDLPIDESFSTAGFLLKAIEFGPNSAYEDSKENEERIYSSGMKYMSHLTEVLMNNINLEAVNNRRKINFDTLHNKLGNQNLLSPVLENGAAMVYPLLVESDSLREYLIENKIFVPTWWRWILESPDTNDFEKKLARYLIPLPVTQSYTVGDMMTIARIVNKKLES